MEKRYGKTKMNQKQTAPQEPLQKRNQTTGYMYSIANSDHSLGNFHVHHNANCVKCKVLAAEMVRVGAVIFCNACVEIEFKTDNPVIEERETYLKWLHKQNGE